MSVLERCQSSLTDGHDAVLLDQVYFNKILEGQYNSTVGKAIGYTEKVEALAIILNNNPEFITHEIWKTNLCKRNAPLAQKLLTPGNLQTRQHKGNKNDVFFWMKYTSLD